MLIAGTVCALFGLVQSHNDIIVKLSVNDAKLIIMLTDGVIIYKEICLTE